MAAGRVEVNLVRLLSRCEAMASENQTACWRFDKYLSALNDFLEKLRKLSTNQPSTEQLSEYTRRIELLSGIMNAEKLPSNSEKSLAIDLLVPSKIMSSKSSGSSELHTKTKARYQKDAREELLGTSDSSSDGGLRKRIGGVGGGNSTQKDEDVDFLLRHHHQMQEKLAEEMVDLARNLKENVRATGQIVREDKEKIVDSSRLADTNYGKLKVESGRLEVYVQKACSWWIWIMLLMVIATFIWMVIFMKMFPKK